MIFYCEDCDDVHRLSHGAIATVGQLALQGEAHYVTREELPGGTVVTTVRMKCPFELGITRTKTSEVFTNREKLVESVRRNVRPKHVSAHARRALGRAGAKH